MNNLGLAFRARKIVIGTEMTIDHIRKGKVSLVLLAHDASELTKKKVLDKAKFYQVAVNQSLSSSELSDAIGKKGIKVIGITDRGFGQLLSQ